MVCANVHNGIYKLTVEQNGPSVSSTPSPDLVGSKTLLNTLMELELSLCAYKG